MQYIQASKADAEAICRLVQEVVKAVYPQYYPEDVVDFFCRLHNRENILQAMEDGHVGVLLEDGQLVGTGSYQENHITRVYVKASFQGRGYGSHIMQVLEDEIALRHASVWLDASLPARQVYQNRGYATVRQERWTVAEGVDLIWDVMEKHFAVGQQGTVRR